MKGSNRATTPSETGSSVLGRGVGDRGRALACLVGEKPSLHAVHQGNQEGSDAGAGHARRRVERFAEDESKGRQHVRRVQDDYDECPGHVDHRHDGSEHSRNAPDPRNAAQDHRGYHAGGNQAGGPRGHAEMGRHAVGHGVGLYAVARKEGGETQNKREEDGHPLPLRPQAPLDVVHRPARDGARPLAFLFLYPEPLGKGNLGVLGRHAQKGGDPHPEKGARASPVNCEGHAGDVADADGCRKRCGQGLKVGDIAGVVGVVILPGCDGDAVTQLGELYETESQR